MIVQWLHLSKYLRKGFAVSDAIYDLLQKLTEILFHLDFSTAEPTSHFVEPDQVWISLFTDLTRWLNCSIGTAWRIEDPKTILSLLSRKVHWRRFRKGLFRPPVWEWRSEWKPSSLSQRAFISSKRGAPQNQDVTERECRNRLWWLGVLERLLVAAQMGSSNLQRSNEKTAACYSGKPNSRAG